MNIYKNDEIYEIIDQVSALYDRLYGDRSHSLKKRIENSISAKLDPVIVTTEHEGQVIGFLFGFNFKPENWWARQVDKVLPKEIDWYQNSFELNELHIDEDYRRQGISYQLMNYLERTVFDYVLLSVRSQNTPAISLYEKLGYQILQENFSFEFGETLFHIMYKQNKE